MTTSAVKLEIPVEPLLDESAGELGLKLWLAAANEAESITAAWLGDRYCLFADGEALAVVWDIRFSSPGAADHWLKSASGIITSRAGLTEGLQTSKPILTPSGRAVVIHRLDPTTVRFANAARMETLNTLEP